jgi:predicted DCC family thiol-disulfide oxidoreductase YuxK
MSQDSKTTAFYDGGCPVCRVEVRHYKTIGGDVVEWVDVCSLDDAALAKASNGKSREDLLGAMHVRDGDQWQIGVAAFPALWAKMPGWRHLTWIFKVPGVTPLAKLMYRGFLAWQRWHRARRLKSTAS